MRRRVVVDVNRPGRHAADVAGEVGEAVLERVGAVAEAGGGDRLGRRDGGVAGAHRRRPPLAPDQGLRARVLGEGHPGSVDVGLAEADSAADVGAPGLQGAEASQPARGGDVAADRTGRRAVVLDRDRQRPQRRPGPRFDAAPFALGTGAEEPVFEGPLGGREAGDELAGGGVGRGCPAEGSEAAVAAVGPEPLLEAVVEGVPPGAAHLDDAGARRRRPAPAREAGAGDGRLAVAGEALQVGAVEGIGVRGGRAVGVGAELRAAGRVGPVGVGADVPAALGDGVLPRPRLRSPPAAAAPAPARSPSRRSGRDPRASPTWLLLRSTASGGLSTGADGLSPCSARAAAGLCENGSNADQGPDHREAARRHRPRAAPLDRRAGHGPLDRDQATAAGSRSSSR